MRAKRLKIGDSVTLESNVLLAPMSGVSDLPFRRLVYEFGAGCVFSEMLACQAVVRASGDNRRRSAFDADMRPKAVQLAGRCPKVMAEAAKICAGQGAEIIDINMGCPVKKVVGGYAGSALMRDEAKAAAIIEAVVKAVSLPVTLKMRTGWDDSSRNAPRLARIAEECGVKMITVHGRTRCQMYKGRADWRFIRQVKLRVAVPVIANGDVATFSDAERILEESRADGVMIGRAVYGKPWLTARIHAALSGKEVPPPLAPMEIAEVARRHYEDILRHYGGHGVKIARKHMGWYSGGGPDSASFRMAFNRADDSKTALRLLGDFFARWQEAYQEPPPVSPKIKPLPRIKPEEQMPEEQMPEEQIVA